MTVYIEDCLIENFLVTFLLLSTTKHILRLSVSKRRIIFASIFGAFVSLAYPSVHLVSILLFFFKVGAGALICAVAFDGKNFIAKYIIFIFLTAFYAGLNILTYLLVFGTMDIQENFPTYILIFILFLIYYISTMCINLARKRSVISNFVYDIKILNNGEETNDFAFLDSGNTLLDNMDLTPIFIINQKLFNRLYKNITFEDLLSKNFKNLNCPHYVNSSYATGGGKILVFEVDDLKISGPNKNIEIKNAKMGLVYAKFDKNFGCNMLLNINVFV